MPIRAITFDWWGTLFVDADNGPRQKLRVQRFAEVANVTQEAVDDALKPVWAEFDRSHRQDQRTLTSADAVRMAAQILGVALTPEQIDDLAEVFAGAVLVHSPVPIDDALNAVKAAAACVPVGIISDTGVSPGRMLSQLLDRHGFTQYFKAMTWSDELDGTAKPNAVNFEQTAQKLGVRPDELLHIGDLRHTDIAGAKGVNAKAALFTGAYKWPGNAPTPNYEFETWPQFIQALPNILQKTA